MLQVIIKLKDQIVKVITLASILALAGLIVATFWQVFSRYIMNASASWTEEAARYFYIWSCLLGSVPALDKGLHAGITVFTDRMKGRFKTFYLGVIMLIVCACAFTIMIAGWQLTVKLFDRLSPAMLLPMWTVNISLAVAGFGMVLTSFVQACELFASLRGLGKAAADANADKEV